MTASEPAPAVRWVALGPLADMAFDPGVTRTVEGREIAVFRRENAFFALDNSCPHAGGPLAEGDLDGDQVRCPWHGWGFDLNTGKCSFAHGGAVATYPVRVVAGGLEVGLPTHHG